MDYILSKKLDCKIINIQLIIICHQNKENKYHLIYYINLYYIIKYIFYWNNNFKINK